jgi:hypothetical protein
LPRRNRTLFPEPTVRFKGTEFDLIRAYEICELRGLHPFECRRVYLKNPVYINDNTPEIKEIGEAWQPPFNEITFMLSTSSE